MHTPRLYLAEGVCAVVEVKSNLAGQWNEVLDSHNRLKPIRRTYADWISYGRVSEQIPHFAVGYRGWKTMATMQRKLDESNLDGLLVLDSGLYCGKQYRETGPQSLYAFFITLQELTGSLISVLSEYKAYALHRQNIQIIGWIAESTLCRHFLIFAELKAAQIGEFFQKGRECRWTFSSKRTLWEKTAPFLRSPVKKRLWLKNHHPKIIAGLTALSHFSLLAPSPLPIFATSIHQWETWRKLGIEELPSADSAEIELEIWYYDPDLFAKNDIVDPFSLYLSLKASQDERIESALEAMMEKIEW